VFLPGCCESLDAEEPGVDREEVQHRLLGVQVERGGDHDPQEAHLRRECSDRQRRQEGRQVDIVRAASGPRQRDQEGIR
jgi:hypothetical protein